MMLTRETVWTPSGPIRVVVSKGDSWHSAAEELQFDASQHRRFTKQDSDGWNAAVAVENSLEAYWAFRLKLTICNYK